MNKLLVVVDMQNDFIDGTLGTNEAVSIVPMVEKKIVQWDGDIVCKTTEEIVDGVLFSTLVMIDGDSSTNDFHSFSIIDRETNTRIDCGYLHDLYLNLHGSYFKPKRKMSELEKKSLLASNSPLNGGV